MSRSRRQKRARSGPEWSRCATLGVLLGVAAFLVSVVIVVFVFAGYARGYLQSEAFQRLVEEKISEALKADVEMGAVRWEGTSAFTNEVRGRGYEDAGFARFDLAGLRADLDLSLSQLKRRVWKVRGVAVSQLEILFSEGGRMERGRESRAGAPVKDEAKGAPSRNLLAEIVPRELELDDLRVNTLNLHWESPGTELGATGMQTVVKPSSGQGLFGVQVRGGAIQGTRVPKLEIDAMDLHWKGREIFVTGAKLRIGEGALLMVRGDIRLGGRHEAGAMVLDAEVTRLPLSRLSKGQGKARVQGELEIAARIEGDPGDVTNSRQEGRVTLRNGVVETLPILEMLARFTGSKRFERIALRDGGGARFVREKGRTVFSEIDFQSDGLARLTGDLEVENGNLDGLLRLGVIPGTLAWIPEAEQKIFTEALDGHLWTEVRVSGTVDDPQHDLTGRLAAAGVEAAVDAVSRILEGGAMDGAVPGDGGTQGGAGRLEDAIDLGREVLKGLFR